jgi:aspartate/methionine/tyrosine aminotransferase
MEVSPFRIERYYARYEFTTRYMLSSSDCESRTIGELLCQRLAAAGVLLLPGSVYDQPEHVRVGFGRANLPEALGALESALATPAAA